jgi:hypothetical protein
MERFDHETQQKLTATTIPFQERNFIDIFTDENIKPFEAFGISFTKILDGFKNAFGIRKQAEISNQPIIDASGKPEDKVNDEFISRNVDKINKLYKIRKYKFLSAYNANRTKPTFNMTREQLSNAQIRKMNKGSIIVLNKDNISDILSLLAPYLRTNDYKIGDEIPVGKIIYNSTQNDVVSEQSFDLPRILKLYVNNTADYAARKEMLPLIQIMKNYYEGIKSTDTTNTNKPIFNKTINKNQTEGTRKHAISQFNDYYQRVILGNFGLRNQYGLKDSVKLYNAEERKTLEEVNEALLVEKDPEKIEKLEQIKKNLGKNLAASAVVDNFLNLVRFVGLSWNLSSGVNNFINGQTDNVLAASSGIYFPSEYLDTITPMEMMYGNSVGLASKKKIPQNVAKAKLIMERYDLLKDASNELQKASTKGMLGKLSRFHPYYQLKKTEEYNQTPINIAILRDTSITDVDGNKSNVWEALEAHWDDKYNQWDLRLKDDFRTKDNIANWEHANGNDYFEFKNKATATITNIHGDFDPHSGMMAKSKQAGQALLMFKTWMPRQFFNRFAVEQDLLAVGKKGFKGRYRSHSGASFATLAALATVATGGLPGALIAGGLGFAAGKFIGAKNGLGLLQELYHT